jgi:ribosomal protein S18 acetylase RimI-like enzyme
VTIRRATEADEPILRELWEAFDRELPAPPGEDETWDEAWPHLARHVREGSTFVVEADGTVVGFAFARAPAKGRSHLTDLYVRPEHRGGGVARRLVAAVAEDASAKGATRLTLDVLTSNTVARSLYDALGFETYQLKLGADIAALRARIAESERAGETFGSIHVQTDDEPAVERALRQFVPRLPGGSRGSVMAAPRHGWVAVYDDVCDRDPKMLRRLARELSDRMGAVVLEIGVVDGSVVHYTLLERGTIMDEYVSVPEHDGPLPPGDVIALAANPRVTARLTGADPERVRAVALQAPSSAQLPPARELLAGVAAALRVEGTEHGWADAPDAPGYRRIER